MLAAHSEMIFLPILPYTLAFLASALPCKQKWNERVCMRGALRNHTTDGCCGCHWLLLLLW